MAGAQVWPFVRGSNGVQLPYCDFITGGYTQVKSFSASFECRVYQTRTGRAEKKWDFGIAGGVHDDVSWVCLLGRSQKFIPIAITWVVLLVANGVKVAFISITSCCVRLRERKNGGNCVDRRTESSPAFRIPHCGPDLTSSLSTSEWRERRERALAFWHIPILEAPEPLARRCQDGRDLAIQQALRPFLYRHAWTIKKS